MKDFDFRLVMNYVVATCCRKLKHRFTHPVSKMYLKSLESVENISFTESVLERPMTDTEKYYDRQFLDYLDHLLMQKYIKFPIPALVKQVETARNNENFQLYSVETYLEFHTLILGLLELLREALQLWSNPSSESKKASEKTPKRMKGATKTLRQLTLLSMEIRWMHANFTGNGLDFW